jgi:photosystem II stability/assembly factor-like uncharacterized protein
MKLISTLALLLLFSTSFSQWTRVQQLPSSDIFTLFHKDNVLYAGGTNVIYVSRDKGQTWDSTTALPGLSQGRSIIDNIIVYKNELYAAARPRGIFKSLDGGTTWQNINAGIDSLVIVSDLCEYRGDLYAATDGSFGNPFYKLNPVGRANWLSFNNGLTGISSNITSIMGNSNALIAGTVANALYDYLPGNSVTWEERLLLGQVSPNEKAYDIIAAHDTFFLAGGTGKFYMSTDNGLNWNLFGNRLVTAASTIVNARQALITSTHFFANGSFFTAFFYIKKDSLQNPFTNFSIVRNHFTYKTDIIGNKLWDASDRGLFFMSLSDLPDISAADDSVFAGPLPVQFISFNANCQGNNVLIKWKTAQEQNSSHFKIERSTDSNHWTAIGTETAAGNSTIERTYSFTDNTPLQNGFYRIAEYDLDGRVQYSGILTSSCNAGDLFSIGPNPVNDKIFINIVSGNVSQASIKIFDSKGALVKMLSLKVLQGNNQFSADIASLTNGIYTVWVIWNNERMKKTQQIIKQ